MARLYAKLEVMQKYSLLLVAFFLTIGFSFLAWPETTGLCSLSSYFCENFSFFWRFAVFAGIFFSTGSLLTTFFLKEKLSWLIFTVGFAFLSAFLILLNQDLPLGGVLFPPLYVVLALGIIYLTGTFGFIFFNKRK